MYKVVYLPTARRQLENAVMYIAVELSNPAAAVNSADRFDEAAQALKEMPYRYPVYPVLYAVKKEIRFFPIEQYNVFYTINEKEKTVEIWRILHRLQNH